MAPGQLTRNEADLYTIVLEMRAALLVILSF